MDGRSSLNPFLICRSDARLCALPLESVAETMRPLPIEPLAGMPPFVLGVAVIRGAAVPVIDAATLLGSATNTDAHRFVTLRVGERRVGLAVEDVLGVRVFPTDSFDEVPPLLRGAGDETVAAIATLDAQLLLVLQGARLLPESAWQVIDSQSIAFSSVDHGALPP